MNLISYLQDNFCSVSLLYCCWTIHLKNIILKCIPIDDEPPTVHVMTTREVVGQDHPSKFCANEKLGKFLTNEAMTNDHPPPGSAPTDNQSLPSGVSTDNQTNEQPPDDYDHTQFDKLIENFKNEDDFCNSFVDFDDTATKQVSPTSRLSEKRSKTEDKEDFVPVEIELDDESEDESDFEEEGEKLSEVKTVVEVAEDIGTEDLFDMRVLGECVCVSTQCSLCFHGY